MCRPLSSVCDGVVRLAAPAADESIVWLVWLLGGLVVLSSIAVLLGVLVGKAVRRQDVREAGVDIVAPISAASLPRPRRSPERSPSGDSRPPVRDRASGRL
jgi:hypothetical protein